MVPYATITQLRRYLSQLPDTAAVDVLLLEILERASAIVDLCLPMKFEAAASGTEVVYGTGTSFLRLPIFVSGSVTLVAAPASYSVPSYVEYGPYLRTVDSTGRMPTFPAPCEIVGDVWYGDHLYFGLGDRAATWRAGVPYSVTAIWGTSTLGDMTVLDALAEATLEIAAAIHKEKDAGFATTVGVEGGGAVNILNELPLKAQAILKRLAERSTPSVAVGVY